MAFTEGTLETPARLRPILVVNPNSNPAVSDLIRAAARRALPAGVRAQVVNPPDSPLSIETEGDKDAAAAKVLRLVDEFGPENYGAIVMACFDDLALDALRGAVAIPVIGTFEAGLMAVRSRARRFGIVTTFTGAVPGIEALLKVYGVAECCGVRAAGIGVAEAAEGGAEALGRVGDAVAAAVEDGAEAVLLGSGGLTGSVPRLRPLVGVPLVDGVEAAIRAAWSVSTAPY